MAVQLNFSVALLICSFEEWPDGMVQYQAGYEGGVIGDGQLFSVPGLCVPCCMKADKNVEALTAMKTSSPYFLAPHPPGQQRGLKGGSINAVHAISPLHHLHIQRHCHLYRHCERPCTVLP